ncbi:hypothetical protein QEZ40_006421 [Streptomyces katrae]|uniref:Uncharacterized protein n=1 Tax=Streptomyces katrae TaxID=68223 RepID=A0ABT7H4S0_9ACTN|nr:hypothetical protein [Streptomyces katrae]MDK9500593.1 hypothetical protein [Streptomyces katrae]
MRVGFHGATGGWTVSLVLPAAFTLPDIAAHGHERDTGRLLEELTAWLGPAARD